MAVEVLSETGMAGRPRVSWTQTSSRMAMSPTLEVLRIRASNSRRCEQCDADPACDSGEAARGHRQELLERVADAESVEHGDRGQQPDQVTGEDDERTDVEEVRPPLQLPAAQQLAGAVRQVYCE